MLQNVSSVLIVDDSRVMRELLVSLLGRHFERVTSAASCKEAIVAIDADRDLDLVICDVYMPDGLGLEVLDHVYRLSRRKPEVILITARWQEEHAALAHTQNVRGYLSKPVSLSEIRLCMKISPQVQQRLLSGKRRGLARAWITDPEEGEYLLAFALHDVSEGGALLETKGPIPVGTSMNLELALGSKRVKVAAHVVRVQEPKWMEVGGVAVVFDSVDSIDDLRDFVFADSESPEDGDTGPQQSVRD